MKSDRRRYGYDANYACPAYPFTLPNLPVRAYSYKSAVENGLKPRTYKVPDEPMDAEAILEFKVWGKSPCLGCYFRNIADGGKFVLYAYDNAHNRRYTPRDGVIDFSEAGIENGLYRIVTRKTRTGKTTWQSAALLFGPDRQEAIAAYIREALW